MMPGIQCYIGRTQAEADDKFARIQALLDPQVGMGHLLLNHFPDMTGRPLDEPVPDLTMATDMKEHRISGREPELTLALIRRAKAENLTLRQLFDVAMCGFWSLGLIGTPTMIADTMEDWFTTGPGRVQRAAALYARGRRGFRRSRHSGVAAARVVSHRGPGPDPAAEFGTAGSPQPVRARRGATAGDVRVERLHDDRQHHLLLSPAIVARPPPRSLRGALATKQSPASGGLLRRKRYSQ